jgi:hypothetical protein
LRVNQKKFEKKKILVNIGNQRQVYLEMDKKKMDLENAYQTIKMGNIKKEENKEIQTKSLAEKEKNKLAEMNKLLDNNRIS